MSNRVINFLYNIDRSIASLFGAPPQETISSEIGRHESNPIDKVAADVLNDIQRDHVENTVIQPGSRGWLTLEITMHAWRFLRIRLGTPIAQIVFHRLEAPTEHSYEGKYQDQRRGPQPGIREREPHNSD